VICDMWGLVKSRVSITWALGFGVMIKQILCVLCASVAEKSVRISVNQCRKWWKLEVSPISKNQC
jgi:hypothetical protein